MFLSDLSDLIEYRIDEKEKIIINTSSPQPNGVPHLGTLMSMACVFAFAQHIKKKYNKRTEVLFDELENCPGEKINNGNSIMCMSLCDVYENGINKSDYYIEFFLEIFNFFKEKSGIEYKIRKYSEFQSEPYFRKGLIKILDDYSTFAKILNPSDKRLHI